MKYLLTILTLSILNFLPMKNDIKLINVYDIKVKEPSGLSLNLQGDGLLTVSDKTGKIYGITFEGESMGMLDFKGKDLEGITTSPEHGHIYTIQEKGNLIIKLDAIGREIDTFKLPKYGKKQNSGIEGITYCSSRESFFLVHEKSPGKLIEWSPSKGVIAENELDFADDYSGICWDPSEDKLWIISDVSGTLVKCNYDGTPIETHTTGITKAEGIAIYTPANEIYIVSDSDKKLYVFAK